MSKRKRKPEIEQFRIWAAKHKNSTVNEPIRRLAVIFKISMASVAQILNEFFIKSIGAKRQFCPKGHDTFIVGRASDGTCNTCKIEYKKNYWPKYYARNKELIKDKSKVYREEHKEEIYVAHKAYYEEHREELLIRKRKYDAEHKREAKNRNLMRKYGISIEDYDVLFKTQGGKCGGCLISQKKLNIPLCVDHDHKTGKVRGLLCSPCNRLLGQLKDSPEVLIRLANYLKKRSTKDRKSTRLNSSHRL